MDYQERDRQSFIEAVGCFTGPDRSPWAYVVGECTFMGLDPVLNGGVSYGYEPISITPDLPGDPEDGWDGIRVYLVFKRVASYGL